MNKIIEKVKEALYVYVARGDRINAAQAAIKALGVIILPKDAEPEVGDVMQDDRMRVAYIISEEHLRFHNMNKIIQRNGQPVIQEEE